MATPFLAASPQVAGRTAGPSDTVELSAPKATSTAKEPCPSDLLLEIRQVFRPRDDDYGRSSTANSDTSRDTGVEIRHQSGGGGCFGPSEHYWTLTVPGSESEQIAIGTSVLSSASGCSVNSDGTFVVGQFYDVRKEERRQSDLQDLKDRGLYSGDKSWSGPSYLLDVPLRKGLLGKLPAAMRRRGWIPQKVLTALPPDAGAFDVGPDNSVAIAQNDRVLRYTRKHGLQPWLQLSQPIEDLEYLSDGSLAVMTSSAKVGSDVYLFRPGQEKDPRLVPFSEAYPELYDERLRARVNGVGFLRDASTTELERFVENSDWLKGKDSWRSWQSHTGYNGRDKSAVVQWKQAPELWTYNRASGESSLIGPLVVPESNRFGAPEQGHFQGEVTQDAAYFVARSSPTRQGGPIDVAVWDLGTGRSELVPGVRDVKLDREKNQLNVRIITGEEKTLPLGTLGSLKNEAWYLKARMADLLDSEADLKPERQIGEDQEKVIVGGVQVRKRD
ncbi:hypothetical protein DYH09_17535 [bacterium CPR1]|nr:hypothetical protein [bacterium CPR1]